MRRLAIEFVACAGLAIAMSGCAYTTAVPAPPGSNVSGIRIYDVKPVLVVTADSYKVEMIPNYNRAYALKFGAFLSKNNSVVQMANGLVTSVTTDLDSTASLELLKLAAERLLPAAQATGTSGPSKSSIYGVYEFRFDDSGELIGLFPLPLKSYPPLDNGGGGGDEVPDVIKN